MQEKIANTQSLHGCWVFEHAKFSRGYRRLPKAFEEDPKMFQSYTNQLKYNLRDKLDIREIINIFASEDM